MDSLSILQLAGWVTVAAVLFLFAATCGFDFGAGMLTPFLGKTDAERRMIINTVGPTWDGNQVWLITAGGAIFAIWPRVYAASFSGLYLAILLVLWALFLRPVAFEYRSKLEAQKWRCFWDGALCIGSFLPALLLGVAVGNLFLGFPFQYNPIDLRFFYGFSQTDTNALMDIFGLLRPFALWTGLMSVLMMLMQGGAYLYLRTADPIQQRAKQVLKVTAILLGLMFLIAGLWLWFLPGWVAEYPLASINNPLQQGVALVQGGWLHNYQVYPAFIIAPLLTGVGLLGVLYFSHQEKIVLTFTASTVTIFGLLATWGLSLYPFLMPSLTEPSQSLTLYNASSSALSLTGILITALVMVPIIFVYTAFVYRKLWGRDEKMSLERIRQSDKMLY